MKINLLLAALTALPGPKVRGRVESIPTLIRDPRMSHNAVVVSQINHCDVAFGDRDQSNRVGRHSLCPQLGQRFGFSTRATHSYLHRLQVSLKSSSAFMGILLHV